MHRMVHSSISIVKPKKVNGIYNTNEFINVTKSGIINELFCIYQEFNSKFGDLIICLDNSEGGYWRKDVYPNYKVRRKTNREESAIDYSEVFKHLNTLIEQIKNSLPWKVISVPRAEADDIILTLAREYNKYENILIHSPDKDMLQAQRNTDTVFQYSSLTKKWLVPENKHDNMEHWIQEHVCLGDDSDDVPRIVDGTEFSKNFIEHLKAHGVNEDFHSPYTFKKGDLEVSKKKEILSSYDVWKTNRKGEKTEIDIYEKPRFSSKKLREKISEHGSLDKWLESHPLYKEHYDRNFTLVMEEGIPSNIWNDIVANYVEAETKYDDIKFTTYLENNSLNHLIIELPNIFKINRALSVDDFNW